MTPTKEQLEQFVVQLNNTYQREVIRINLSIGENLSLTDSKIGGLPYIPKGATLPTTSDGELLFMLAQINCEQLPENGFYPKKGLLQFWIAQNIYGEEYEVKHIRFYHTFSQELAVQDIKELYILSDCELPFDPKVQFALHFTKEMESISTSDEHFYEIYKEKWEKDFSEQPMDLLDIPDDIYDKFNSGEGHKIGGYPAFAQDDPREKGSYTELLLQIDSDYQYDIMWGDGGVANFFINKEDLTNCNFEDVLYSWDCG